MSREKALSVSVTVLALLLAGGPARTDEAPRFGRPVLVSAARDGASSGNSSSGLATVSATGRYVTFLSVATDLVSTPDGNGTWDLFRRDRVRDITELVTVNRQGTASGNGEALLRGYSSADGRIVAFTSAASDLVAVDTNRSLDAFVRDMDTSVTSLVSVNRLGDDSGNGASAVGGISADGRYVLFTSGGSNLVANDDNGAQDVFVRDLEKGRTILVSVNADGTGSAEGGSERAQMTPDGRFVVYLGFVDDHVAEDDNGAWDVFVRDLKTGTTSLVSANADGTGAAYGFSEPVAISADGKRVVFESSASDLVARDTNQTTDVFVRDLERGETFLISVSQAGNDSGSGLSLAYEGANPDSVISADGRFVVFWSWAADLVPNDPDGSSPDVFVRDLALARTLLATEGPDGLASHDNTMICCQAIERSGRFVVFGSTSPAFTSSGIDDSNRTFDLFLRDLHTGSTQVLTRSVHQSSTADRDSYRPAFSADGHVLVFESQATDLVLGDGNGAPDVFLVSAELEGPPPPPLGPWLRSPRVAGFDFKVRISSGSGSILGSGEAACIPETVCVSGAMPGRSEVFLRVVGPKPNGRLWPTLVKFSTSTVEVWIRQDGTGEVRYYRLEGARPGVDELPGRFDREGFAPIGSGAGPLAARLGLMDRRAVSSATGEAPEPPAGVFTSDEIPGYRFHARITVGDQVQEVRQETLCIEETLCLSGAVPGRSEVFVRIVGPKPNGWYWPTIVKFTTSTLEVWIERASTGETKYYRIEGARAGHDDLTGLFDRRGFY